MTPIVVRKDLVQVDKSEFVMVKDGKEVVKVGNEFIEVKEEYTTSEILRVIYYKLRDDQSFGVPADSPLLSSLYRCIESVEKMESFEEKVVDEIKKLKQHWCEVRYGA